MIAGAVVDRDRKALGQPVQIVRAAHLRASLRANNGREIAMKKLGSKLLGVWLLLTGLMGLLHFGFPYAGTLLAVLALVAGILILADR